MGVARPSRIDLRIPGMFSKKSVSCIDRQSSSDTSTALPRFPVMTIGSWEEEASSISRYNFDLASVAVKVGMSILKSNSVLPLIIRFSVRFVKVFIITDVIRLCTEMSVIFCVRQYLSDPQFCHAIHRELHCESSQKNAEVRVDEHLCA